MSSSSSSSGKGVGYPTTCRECAKKAGMDLTKSHKAALHHSPVVLASGNVDFEIVLLTSDAIGTGGFSFAISYSNLAFNPDSDDEVLGKGFQFTQDVSLVQSEHGVTFRTAERTKEEFAHVGGGRYSSAKNNTASTLSRRGAGTSADEFTLRCRGGVTSRFYGFHSSIGTPGRLKSFSDRYDNKQTHHWEQLGGKPRLVRVVDSYGRKSHLRYYDSSQNYRLKEVEDFLGRKVNFQYDLLGHLVAVVGPSITRGANGNANVFPNGTAYVFRYDTENARPERRDDLTKVWYPNQVDPYLASTRTVDVDAVYAHARARQHFSYYNDPTDTYHYGKVQEYLESASGSGSIGSGACGYLYVNTGLPVNKIDHKDPITTRTIATDRMGNQTAFDFNAAQVLVHKQVFATRGKNSLQAASWETWIKYNTHNQTLRQVNPEGDSLVNEYEDETNTITINGVPYAPRIGLLKSSKRLPGNSIGVPSRPGSNGQTELEEMYFHDPLFGQVCAGIEPRGNPITASGKFFKPQNGGITPTKKDRSRYATTTFFDYQKDSTATVQGDSDLQAQLGLTSTQIGQLIAFVDNQMNAGGTGGPLPAGFQMGLGDVNGEGTGAGTGTNARHQGCTVKVQLPTVRQLIPHSGGAPWMWQSQTRIELYTNNARGQATTFTNAEGNLAIYIRFPENNPDGDNDVDDPGLSNHQYGRLKQVVTDANPDTVMTLVGADGDMITFIGNIIPRTNTPGIYQSLTTTHQGPSGCTSCNYDPLGNVLTTVDARGNMTTFDRNELGEIYRVTLPAPYNFQIETSYDANRNKIQIDTQDMVVLYTSNDPADPNYAKFIPTGSGTTANVPMTAGSGGSVRPGWFSNLYSFDLLDNKIEEDIDATGSSPASLVTRYAYDFNQNLIKTTKPLGNTEEYDYDERNIRFATRIGGPTGSVTVQAFDGNGNLIDVVGPAQRGTASQSLTVVINDAFNGTVNQSYTGDWVAQNTYDGFDRQIENIDAVGGVAENTFDPNGRTIATLTLGTAGGATPTDRSGSQNVALSSGIARFDEAGRAYENQRSVFLNTGISGSTTLHNLPSGRTATYTGGGLAANSTTNSHTGTVTLTAGGQSYILSRTVFDRAGRTAATATDNGALGTFEYDGADRQPTSTDPLGNVTNNVFDANSNVTGTTSVQTCTISGSIPTESFGALMLYDVLNQLVQNCAQGADGSLSSNLSDPNTLFTLTGRDSRGNKTNVIDPKQNTTVWKFDGASRNLEGDQHLRAGGEGTNAIVSTVTTKQAFDANSRFVKLTDSNGGTTNWAYDLLDRETLMKFHDGSTRVSVYDAANDVTGYTDENQSMQARTFDVLGRKTAVNLTLAGGVAGTTAQSFQFDGLRRMTFARDTIGSSNVDVGFVFDSIGRTIDEWQTLGGDTRYVTHDQWTSLTPTDLAYPNGRQVTSGFDAVYRRNTLNETSGGASIATWQFFGGRTATVTFGNGIVTSFMSNAQNRSAVQFGQTTPVWGDITTDHLGYDGAGRPIGKRHFNGRSVIVGNTSAYDLSSNKSFERALHAESRSHLYPEYDSMNRLLEYQRGTLASGGGSVATPISLPGTNQEQDYNLDALGNWSTTTITPEGGSPSVQTRIHNKLNQVNKYGSTYVTYDHGNNVAPHATRGNGNIADDGVRLYVYDVFNRLIIVKRKIDGAIIAQYAYDALGRRVLKIVTNGGLSGTIFNNTYRYVSDGQQIIEELNGSNATTRQFIWGQYIDELIQLTTCVSTGTQPLAVGTYYPLSDLLYRSQALTDSGGNIVEAYDCDAYGNTLIYSGPGTDGLWFTDDDLASIQPACETIFTGREYDSETDLYFYRERYYHPVLGRFVNKDPILYYGGVNIYLMVMGNPVTAKDPFGLRAGVVNCDTHESNFQIIEKVIGKPTLEGHMIHFHDQVLRVVVTEDEHGHALSKRREDATPDSPNPYTEERSLPFPEHGPLSPQQFIDQIVSPLLPAWLYAGAEEEPSLAALGPKKFYYEIENAASSYYQTKAPPATQPSTQPAVPGN